VAAKRDVEPTASAKRLVSNAQPYANVKDSAQ